MFITLSLSLSLSLLQHSSIHNHDNGPQQWSLKDLWQFAEWQFAEP